jgi:hypothetical protein
MDLPTVGGREYFIHHGKDRFRKNENQKARQVKEYRGGSYFPIRHGEENRKM